MSPTPHLSIQNAAKRRRSEGSFEPPPAKRGRVEEEEVVESAPKEPEGVDGGPQVLEVAEQEVEEEAEAGAEAGEEAAAEAEEEAQWTAKTLEDMN